MVSDEVYTQVVEELGSVRQEWRRVSRDLALAMGRIKNAETENAELRKELDIRKAELRRCREETKELESKIQKATPTD